MLFLVQTERGIKDEFKIDTDVEFHSIPSYYANEYLGFEINEFGCFYKKWFDDTMGTVYRPILVPIGKFFFTLRLLKGRGAHF